MTNPFVHVELNTTDLNKAQSFYGQLFNWETEATKCRTASTPLIKVGEGRRRHAPQKMPGAPSEWLPYVAVDDIQAATERRGSSAPR